MKLYRVLKYTYGLEEIEADRANEKTVWIKGRREGRHTSYANYYDIREEAIKQYREKLMNAINYHSKELAKAQNSLSLLDKEQK
jgi:hypothetical protein